MYDKFHSHTMWLRRAIEDYCILHDVRQARYNDANIPYWQRILHDAPSLYAYLPAMFLWEYHSKAELIAINEVLSLIFQNLQKGDNTMARAKQTQNDFTGWTMINLELNSVERQAFKVWYTEALSEFDSMLAETLGNGYKISMSYSAQQAMYYATLTQTDDDAKDAKSSQTSQASEPIKAIMLAMFKFIVIGKYKLVASKPDDEENFR